MSLRYEGSEVDVAADGRSALARAATVRPHLMVPDARSSVLLMIC